MRRTDLQWQVVLRWGCCVAAIAEMDCPMLRMKLDVSLRVMTPARSVSEWSDVEED